MHIDWDDEKYSIGIVSIDNQHKELISITNSLFDAHEKGRGQKEILSLLRRLNSYTHYHFLSEEDLFNQHSYPQKDNHNEIHQEFTSTVKSYFDEIKKGSEINLSDVLRMLVNWIGNHILGEDQEYAQFLKEKGVKISEEYPKAERSPSKEGDSSKEDKDLLVKQKISLYSEDFDNQHRELVYILQQVSDLNKTGISDNRVKIQLPVLIKKLYYYSQYHFDLEETLMKKKEYPGLKKHREQHIDFMGRIALFAKDYHSGKRGLTDEIIQFLRDWTVNHTLQDDGDFKMFMEGKVP